MDARECDPSVIEATSLKAYFHETLSQLFDQCNGEFSQEAQAYVVNLLHYFSRSEQFFEWYERRLTLRPLALLYGEALLSSSLQERRIMLRRLGDVALFVAGMFAPSLERKVVGVDYYIDMGCRAYDSLSDSLERTGSRALGWRTFRELAEHFADFVSVLDEFAGQSGLHGARSVERFVSVWKKLRERRGAAGWVESGLPYGSKTVRH